ncbi:MAG: glycosyltransferase family 4 protein [Calothrix sp. C42_A2020_038]|nr:glycosyltransferase family 4 protein [Calothrix sp. C42_A2020_038]
MLKVVIDATPVYPKPSGVGYFVANLISSLSKLQERDNFSLGIVFQPGLKSWLRGSKTIPECLKAYSDLYFLPMPVRISDLLLATENKSLFSYFEKYFGYPHIVHGTNYSVYPCHQSFKVMNLYDLTFVKYPNYIDSVVAKYTERVKRCLKWTDLVMTISESSKRDIVEYLNVDPDKIYVTPLASRYDSNSLSARKSEILLDRFNYDFSRPYLLFVSTIEPRKNINALITAFNYLKSKYHIPHNLVLIGKKGWRYEPIFNAINDSPWSESIYHLDYLSDELVALFYSKADVFVYPSHYEGFGLPVLEAMTLGAPVISSNSSSIPEVAGDAAVLINPAEPIELAESILKVISDSYLRQDLIAKGKERAKLFTWERTARETLKAYKSLVEPRVKVGV